MLSLFVNIYAFTNCKIYITEYIYLLSKETQSFLRVFNSLAATRLIYAVSQYIQQDINSSCIFKVIRWSILSNARHKGYV